MPWHRNLACVCCPDVGHATLLIKCSCQGFFWWTAHSHRIRKRVFIGGYFLKRLQKYCLSQHFVCWNPGCGLGTLHVGAAKAEWGWWDTFWKQHCRLSFSSCRNDPKHIRLLMFLILTSSLVSLIGFFGQNIVCVSGHMNITSVLRRLSKKYCW